MTDWVSLRPASAASKEAPKQYRDLFPWLVASGFGLLAVQLVLAESVGRRLP